MLLDKVKAAINITRIEMNNGVKSLLENNIYAGLKYDGGKVKKLSKAWIKRKGHSRPFLWKGLLQKSVRDKQTKSGYEIYISNERNLVAGYLQRDRPFFGFNKRKGENIIDSAIRKGFNNF